MMNSMDDDALEKSLEASGLNTLAAMINDPGGPYTWTLPIFGFSFDHDWKKYYFVHLYSFH